MEFMLLVLISWDKFEKEKFQEAGIWEEERNKVMDHCGTRSFLPTEGEQDVDLLTITCIYHWMAC